MSDPITVVLADDHAVVRAGLHFLLDAEDGVVVVGEAGDFPGAVAAVAAHRPAVLVLDLGMPGGSGLETITWLSETAPDTAIVVLTMQDDPAFARGALSRGARGYVLKEAGHDTIVRAIDRVSRGEDFIDPALAPSLLELSRESLITAREREILQLLADGMSNADVAQKLFISQETVKSHVRHILAKLEADNRTQAVAIALRESIIE